ncbi:hypothetical protein B0H19DRAFT_1100838 [Mycena capillaripes]|nr:hypothetical protein B0H19DRAFT_1100838 [Mycena capillaripes]
MASQDPKPMPPSNPQLPQHLWKRFKKEFPQSIIFSSAFSVARHGLVTGEIRATSSEFVAFCVPKMDGVEQFLELGPSWLHLAIAYGDLPLACEALRLGCPIQHPERRGYSPVYFGCAWVERYVHHGRFKDRTGKPHVIPDKQIPELMKGYSKMLEICVFLIQQHSDPNAMHKGVSLLHLACLIGSWDLIRALLLHGAKPANNVTSTIHPIDMFETPSDKARFTALVSQYCTQVRPARPCPCASGRPLSECHATYQPYPAEYLCPCCSHKIYAKCCQKRPAFAWYEEWTDETQFHYVQKVIQPMKFSDPEEQAKFVAKLQSSNEAEQRDLLPTPEGTRATTQRLHAVIQCLALCGKVDRAFAKAAEKTGYLPRPGWNDGTSKIDGKEAMNYWNQVIDDYIASGVDNRGRRIIENSAKIGIAGGPLFRNVRPTGAPTLKAGLRSSFSCARAAKRG